MLKKNNNRIWLVVWETLNQLSLLRTYQSKFAFKNDTINLYFLCAIFIASIYAANAQTPSGLNLVAYDGFNYGSGTSLLNANGGSGWSNPWSKAYQDRYLKTATTGFTYTGLSTQGLKAEFDSACYGPCNEIAALGRSFPLQNDGVVYIQFISVFEASGRFGTPGIRLSAGGVGTGVIGAQTGSLMSICSPAANLSSSIASLSAQNFVVVRIDYNMNKTEMWVNPNLSTFDYSNPVSPSATAIGFAPAFDRFDIFIRSGSIDEISIFAQPTSAPSSISGTTTVCSGTSTTLTSTGGSIEADAVDVWYQGACGGDAFHEGWDTQPTSTVQTTINSNLNGILNVTSTGVDPQINMFNRGSFDPAVYKYINFRYRVVSGTAGSAQLFFLNGSMIMADGSKYLNKTLISDNQWHTASVDMSANALWATGGNITGIRYDYATASGATLDLDFIELSSAAVVGTGSSITVTPSATTTYYANRKGYTINTTCVSQTVTVNPLPAAPTATAIQRFCPSDTVTSLQATVGAGETLAWFANASGGSVLTAATTLAAGNYYAQATNALGCSSARTLVVVSFNNALYFDGVNDYISLTSNSIPDGATEFTIEAWIKPDNSNFDGLYHAVFGNQTGGDANTRNPSFYLKSGGIHIDSYEDTTLTRYALLSPAAEILQNVWSHIALVKQANLFYVYINGQLSFTASAPNAINITGPYQFGFIDNYFAGKMDEIRFWSVARTASEIATNMNQFLSGTETGLVDYYTFDQGIQNGSNTGLTTLNDKTATTNNGTLNSFALAGTTSNYVPGYFAQIIGTTTIQLGTTTQLSHLVSAGSWTSSNTNIATVSNSGLVTSVAVGTTTVSYTSCGQTTTVTITVALIPPTISNFNNMTKMYHDGTFTIGAPISNSTGAFGFSSSNTGVATISGTTVTIISAGTSIITASQVANGNYNTASITATLTVSSVSVLTKGGGISGTNLNYVNQYGQIGGNFGLSANGSVLAAKTPPPIISAGLVLYLDAGNTASYMGTGTTWTDLSGNGNHGTLQNGVVFNNANNGSLVFDGLNDFFVTNSNLDLSSTDKLTIQIILKTAAVNEEMIMEHSVDWNTNNSFGIISKNNKMQITDHNQNYNVSNSVDSINDNNWHLLSATTDRSLGGADQNLIYLDGKAANKVNVANLSNDNSGNFTSHKLYLSSRASSSYFFNGAIAQVLIYDRVLTAAEIQQNFYAVKLKYGL